MKVDLKRRAGKKVAAFSFLLYFILFREIKKEEASLTRKAT